MSKSIKQNFTIFSTEVKAKIQKIEKFKQAHPRITARQLKNAVDQILIMDIKKYLIENDIIFTKALYNSIQSIITNQGRKLTSVQIVTPGVNYAMDVEEGLPPGTIQDYNKLVEWCKVKLGLDEAKAKRAAYAVRNAIFIKGTQGYHFFENTLKMSKQRLFNRFLKNLQANIKLDD